LMEQAHLVEKTQGPAAALPYTLELAQQEPENIEVLAYLAQVQHRCKDYSSAESTAYIALHLFPEHPELNALLGRLKRKTGQLDQAVHYLSEAARYDPENQKIYMELAEIYKERREDAHALMAYECAARVNPMNYQPYFAMAQILKDSKDFMGAEGMLRKAAQCAPDDLNIRRQLGAVIALNLVHHSQEVNKYL